MKSISPNPIHTIFLLSALALLSAHATAVTVTSNPLWTDTGVTLTSGQTVIIHGPTGTWRISPSWPWAGPEGNSIAGYEWDEWVTNSHHAQLIGFIGPVGVDPNTHPRVVPQHDPSLFEISTNTVTITNKVGRLWLGCNDGYRSGGEIDNVGSLVVQVDVQRPVVTIHVSAVEVCWNSKTNRSYQVQYQSALTSNAWVNLGGIIPGNGSTNCMTDTTSAAEKRFYQVEEFQ